MTLDMSIFNRRITQQLNFSDACRRITMSNPTFGTPIRLPEEYRHTAVEMIPEGVVVLAHFAERRRKLRELFLLQDILQRHLPTISVTMIFQYLEKDPTLTEESTDELLNLRASL